jgi:hypothetical protein
MAVEYFEYPEMPGVRMFKCVPLLASLRVDACKERWVQANGKDAPDRLHKCKQCKVGAAHVGVTDAAVNLLRGTNTCSRCHRSDMRLIGGNMCVCCMNRQYEWIKGRNGRGKFPITHPVLSKRVIRYVVAGQALVLTRPLTASMDELTVELLRRGTTRGKQGSLLCGGLLDTGGEYERWPCWWSKTRAWARAHA